MNIKSTNQNKRNCINRKQNLLRAHFVNIIHTMKTICPHLCFSFFCLHHLGYKQIKEGNKVLTSLGISKTRLSRYIRVMLMLKTEAVALLKDLIMSHLSCQFKAFLSSTEALTVKLILTII